MIGENMTNMLDEVESRSEARARAAGKTVVVSGNEAAARAILDIGYDGEGYYPITPSSEVGEIVDKAIAAGKSDMAFVVGTSELAAISTVTGMALAGGRAVDVTSAQGLLLKAEEMPAISGLGLPVVLNLSTREVSAPLNIKNGHSDLAAALGWGWLIFLAPSVQAVYDMNFIALRLAEAVNLPALVAYDGFHTSHAYRRIQVFADPRDGRDFVGEKPPRATLLDVHRPLTFGPYMNDDLINTKVQMQEKMREAYRLLPDVFQEFHELTGRGYDFVDVHGSSPAEAALVALNTAGEAAKISANQLRERGRRVKLVMPLVLRPWPEEEIVAALSDAETILVAERVVQYGARNYLANEIGASLQAAGCSNRILTRSYGIGGLDFRAADGIALFEEALSYGKPESSVQPHGFYGAWPGDPQADFPERFQPLTVEESSINAKSPKVDLRALSEMPSRVDRHSACPGCGIFSNLNLFLSGIDGHVVLLFNTGCGMVTTTGYPFTSFKVPYAHNLFHNGASTATGVVEMYHRFRRQGKIKEEITFVVVSGDGGDDIGMDQVIGAALRNDPFIMIEYDNKGYMNTGGQLCYTGLLGQRSSNANLGPGERGKHNHHKDIIEILRGTHAPYLFQASEYNYRDTILKARKAQATVRHGGFAFGRLFSVCPLNWGTEPDNARPISERVVKSCLFPLYEVEHGITKLSYNPEKAGQKLPVTEALALMGKAFGHLAGPKYADVAAEIQAEVDRRWARLLEMDANPKL